MAEIKLFVDDLRDPPEGWHLARTVTEAIRVLATAPVRVAEVSVDHDITHDGRDCPETFEPVVRYIALMPPGTRPDKAVIHTANVVQAGKLKQILADAGIKAEANLAR
ncbi:MAG: cyclic-phosphate processing receiver domain-containing protein [Chloroflexota bacterium]